MIDTTRVNRALPPKAIAVRVISACRGDARAGSLRPTNDHSSPLTGSGSPSANRLGRSACMSSDRVAPSQSSSAAS